ncbi:MAG: O-antigen ligase family protein [Herminiimonas sp.]|nr:O-antigen ligase family protein [Herminiimonas sp.]
MLTMYDKALNCRTSLGARSADWPRQALILLTAAMLGLGLAEYPFLGWILGLLALYAVLLIKWPRAPLVLLPALLPVLDFAPLTGRFFLDEFDLLILTTLIVSQCRSDVSAGPVRFPSMAGALAGLLALSTVVAAGSGMWPLQWPDINAFNNYYSSFNGLRVAKGLLWCGLLLPAIRHELGRDAAATHRLFGLGMTLGVAAAAAIVLWERSAFTGLFNFGSGYRVTGAFSAMHVGGAYIEGYFVLGLPFVAWGALIHRKWPWRLFCLGVFIAGVYCMMVTYARGGYVAMLLGIVALVAIIPFMKTIVLKPVQAFIMAVLFSVVAAVAVPVLQGEFMKGRFSSAQVDLRARAARWMQALNMMDHNAPTVLLGMGSGRYPSFSALAAGPNARPAGYRFGQDPRNTYLQLSPGLPLYFEQVVDVRSQHQYRITFSARSTDEAAAVSVPVCEKWMLYSATCFIDAVRIGDTQGRWKQYALTLETAALAPRAWHALRPLKLALHNTGAASVDIDNVSMTSQGIELIRNGGFEQRMDYWFFSVDDFVAWHFENMWLQLYFEQGAVGLLLFMALIVCTALRSISRFGDQDFPLPALGAAVIGFLALGTLDSLFDFPRLGLLFYMMLAFILLRPVQRKNESGI